MSINVNGSFEAFVIENEFPESDYAAWEVSLSVRITASGSFSRFLYARTREGPSDYPGFSYNASSWDGIRCGTFGGDQAGYIEGTPGQPGAVPLEFAPDAVWARLVVYSEGVLDSGDPDYDAGLPWQGRIRFAWIVLEEPTRVVRHLPGSLLTDDVRLAGQYIPELVVGFGGDASADFEIRQLGVWSRALSDSERLAQARTATALYTGDLIHYEDLFDVASLTPSSYAAGWEWSGTPIDGATDPEFPDDDASSINASAAFEAPPPSFSASVEVEVSASAVFVSPEASFSISVGVEVSASSVFEAPPPTFSASVSREASISAAFEAPTPNFSGSANAEISAAAAFEAPPPTFSAAVLGDVQIDASAAFVAPSSTFSAFLGVLVDVEGFSFVAPAPTFSARISTRSAPRVSVVRTIERRVRPYLLTRVVP